MPALDIEVRNDIALHRAPPGLIRQAKADLTFNNPEYDNALRHGRSTRGIPRKIRTYDDTNGSLRVPRGYNSRLRELVLQKGLTPNYIYKTSRFDPVFPPKKIKMWDYQEPWISNLLSDTQGVGVSPPGSGKTIMGLEMYARLGQPCLWITHTGRLARQARKRAEEFLGIETGILGKGEADVKHFTVGMVQTLVRRDLEEYRDKFGLIILDECHHLPAVSFTKVVSAFDAHYRYGLTATPYRDDCLEKLMFQVLGLALATMDKQTLRERDRLMTPTVLRRPTKFVFPYNAASKKHNYKALDDALAINEGRNRQIATDVIVESSLDERNICIVLVGRIPHGGSIFELLDPVIPGVGFVHSKMTFKKSDKILDAFEAGELRVLVATYKMLAEGFDYQPANRLFLTGPYKGRTRIEQACGRIERTYPGKTDAFVYDYVDKFVGVLNRQAEVRLDVFEANDMPVTTLDL